MTARVVITGRGVWSPLGKGWPAFAEALRSGATAPLAPLPGAWPDDPPLCHLLADLESLGVGEPLSRVAAATAREALEDAGFHLDGSFLDDVGLVMSTVLGPSGAVESYLERLREKGPRASRPAQFVDTLLSMPGSRVGIELGLRGSTAVLGGSSPFELALDWVRRGGDRAVVAGGSDVESPKCARFYRELVRRSGADRAPLAQGAAFVVLEAAAQAAARGARAHAELLGAGAASEPQQSALPWSADPAGRAFACAMRGALADAGTEPDAVHAAVLAAGDAASEATERAALEAVFGDRAASLPVLTPKRSFGEALAASAGLGLLSALVLLDEGSVAVVNAFEAGGATASLLVRVLAR